MSKSTGFYDGEKKCVRTTSVHAFRDALTDPEIGAIISSHSSHTPSFDINTAYRIEKLADKFSSNKGFCFIASASVTIADTNDLMVNFEHFPHDFLTAKAEIIDMVRAFYLATGSAHQSIHITAPLGYETKSYPYPFLNVSWVNEGIRIKQTQGPDLRAGIRDWALVKAGIEHDLIEIEADPEDITRVNLRIQPADSKVDLALINVGLPSYE